MSDDDSSKKIASSKDFGTTTIIEDVTNADLLSLFKTYMNEKIDGIQRNVDDKTHSLAKMVKKNDNSFKFKGNGIPFDLNSDLIDNLERAQHYLELKTISRASHLLTILWRHWVNATSSLESRINPTEVGILYKNTFRTR